MEEPTRADVYNGESIAEQHSLSVAWELLHENRFSNLRTVMFPSPEAKNFFRSLIVNGILATDIAHKNMRKRREERFNAIIKQVDNSDRDEDERAGLQAAVLVDLVMQAADVSHTMQHWDTYLKWNMVLFCEMQKAYQDGRSKEDPTVNWLEGEMLFFDYYVIPLTRKLQSSGGFGVSGDECVMYALENRRLLGAIGKEIFAEMFLHAQTMNETGG